MFHYMYRIWMVIFWPTIIGKCIGTYSSAMVRIWIWEHTSSLISANGMASVREAGDFTIWLIYRCLWMRLFKLRSDALPTDEDEHADSTDEHCLFPAFPRLHQKEWTTLLLDHLKSHCFVRNRPQNIASRNETYRNFCQGKFHIYIYIFWYII